MTVFVFKVSFDSNWKKIFSLQFVMCPFPGF